jgi:hypothetical protein
MRIREGEAKNMTKEELYWRIMDNNIEEKKKKKYFIFLNFLSSSYEEER